MSTSSSYNSRRNFLKQGAVVAAAASIPSFSFNIISRPVLGDELIGHGAFKYRVHQAWGNLNPATTPVNNCHEMVQARNGKLYMITDDTHNNVIVYDKSGKLLDSWGTTFKSGHGLTLAQEGEEDFLWICDPHWENPSVVKMTLDGREVLRLPDPRTIGVYEKDDAYKPTETAVGPNGEVYVADGYGSQWVLQFSSTGEFIRKFGGKGDGDSQFSTVHGVTVDYRDATGPTLLCTSRGHNAFKRFTLDGEYLSTIFLPGAYVCRPVIDDDTLYAGVCWSRLRYLNQTPNSGFVTILDKEGKVVSNPGGTRPKYRKNELQLMLQDKPIFKHCHDVCVDDDKNLYICQWNAGKSYPIKLERV
ncbi:6-bladed beta-propeller [Marinoscillum furvescens]|uniref:Secreted protein n=1 Tax=Marinoscillum furvescens DSM 4134 TaxID=1122208 RepID=A0A3D9L7A4_MARFU|nr:6-bladed beta-propeller [Marinoscillum furvescens]REE00213.1 secreted protein [Marinoscillum furvescens DSM 4134]